MLFLLIFQTAVVPLSTTSNAYASGGDNTPPVLESSQVIGPEYLNVGDSFEVIAEISDDLSGVQYSYVYFRSPSNNRTATVELKYDSEAELWVGTHTVGEYDEEGTWTYNYFSARDYAGNWGYVYRNQLDDSSKYDFYVMHNPAPKLESLSINSQQFYTSDQLYLQADLRGNDATKVKAAFLAPSNDELLELDLEFDSEADFWNVNHEMVEGIQEGKWSFNYLLTEAADGSFRMYDRDTIGNPEQYDFSFYGEKIDPLPETFITTNQLWTNEIITGDLYIGPNAILTISGNVRVEGNVYVFGAVRNFGNLTINGTLHANRVIWGSSTLYHGTFLMLGGTNYISSMKVSSQPMEVPLKVYNDELIVEDGELTFKGATLPIIDLYANGEKIPLNGDGTFKFTLPNILTNKVTFEIVDVFYNRTTKVIDVINDDYDDIPPFWPEGSKLSANEIGENSVMLTWDPAQDNQQVGEYLLYKNGERFASFEEDVFQYELLELQPYKSYTFELEALDPTGNRTETKLELEVETKDETAPHWAEGSRLEVIDLGETELTLTWPDAKDNAWIDGYQLYQNGEELVSLYGDETSFVMTGLEVNQEYLFSVQAMDAAGNVSAEILEVVAKTKDVTAPYWPAESVIEINDLGETELTLTWGHAEDNSWIQGYRLYQDGEEIAQLSADETESHLTGLTPFTMYHFSVEAVDAAGNRSEQLLDLEVQTKDETAPYWPEGSRMEVTDLSETELTLTWSAATDNGLVTSYTLYKDGEEIAELSSDERSYTMISLNTFQNYHFSVEAVDAAGNRSKQLLDLEVQTKDETAPHWPEESFVEVGELAENELTLTWSEAIDNISIGKYRIYVNGEEYVEVTDTAYKLTELNAFEEYMFTVEAIDTAGNVTEEKLEVTAKTKDETIPFWPEESALQIKDLGETEITLTWDPAQDNSAIAEYQLYMNGEPLGAIIGSENQYFVVNLTPFEDYHFAIEAVDLAGHWTETKLEVEVKTKDETAPYWPDGNSLVADHNIYVDRLTLTWGHAKDNGAIDQYLIFLDGELLAEVDGEVNQYSLMGIKEYEKWLDQLRFDIKAFDTAGNQTAETQHLYVPLWQSEPKNLFTDINNNRFHNEINYLGSREIIFGIAEGVFAPDQPVTRAAAAIMIARALQLDGTQRATSFPDVRSGHSASGFIQSAYEHGIIYGFPNGSFRPDEFVTRGQMAIFLARAFELEHEQPIHFRDVTSSMNAYSSIKKILAEGITVGYPDGTYRPDETLTRAQFSAFLSRALEEQFR